MQQLRDDDVRDAVVDLGADVDDPVGEQPAVDVDRPLAAHRLLDDAGNRVRAHARTPNVAADRAGVTALTSVSTWSTKPYSRASSAVNHRSRSESRSIRSRGWPVCSEISESSTFFTCSRFSAWISMSIAVPPMPAEPWCMRIRECGSA